MSKFFKTFKNTHFLEILLFRLLKTATVFRSTFQAPRQFFKLHSFFKKTSHFSWQFVFSGSWPNEKKWPLEVGSKLGGIVRIFYCATIVFGFFPASAQIGIQNGPLFLVVYWGQWTLNCFEFPHSISFNFYTLACLHIAFFQILYPSEQLMLNEHYAQVIHHLHFFVLNSLF